MKIRRTKTGQGGPDGLPPSTSVLWAAASDEEGCVTLWVRDEAQARDFDEARCGLVRGQYAGRPAAGALEFLGGPEATQAAAAAPAPANLEEHLAAFRAAAARANKDRPGSVTPAAVKAKLREIREDWAVKTQKQPQEVAEAPPPPDGA